MSSAPVVSITDELVAELETSVCCVWPESNSAVTTLRALLSERAEMQQQLHAAMISVDNCELFRKDAERYQFWSRTACYEPMKMAKTIAHCCTPDDLDAAIDAAMQEQKQ